MSTRRWTWQTALCVFVLVIAPMSAANSTTASDRTTDSPDISLYRFTRVPRVELHAIDPASLVDLADRPPMGFGDDVDLWQVVVSRDGKTAATIGEAVNGIGPIVAIVRDASTFEEQRRFEVPGSTRNIVLSDDGSRLVARGELGDPDQSLMTPFWRVYDTATGTILITIEGDPANDVGGSFAVDGAAKRLYRLTFPGGFTASVTNNAPATGRLIVNDLTTGAEIGQIDLPGVRGGVWVSAEPKVFQGAEIQVPGQLSPAFVLSPDGRQLAIVHADTDTLTLIDTEQLTVEQTSAFAPHQGWLDRLLGLVPLWPQEAGAKMLDGTLLDAVFSSDGRFLYVTGISGAIEDEQAVMQSLGVRVIDVATGELIASGWEDWTIGKVWPSPDGSGIYVMAWGQQEGTALWRLHPKTLDRLAQRTFGDYPDLIVAPSPDGIASAPPNALGWTLDVDSHALVSLGQAGPGPARTLRYSPA